MYSMVAKYRVCPSDELGIYDAAHGVPSGLSLLVGTRVLQCGFYL